MGTRGKVPKRPEERRRRNKDEGAQIEGTASTEVTMPPADEEWHRIAKQLYESLADSGQSEFYEPSDWAMAYMIAESISRDLEPQVVGIAERTGEAVFEKVPMKGASLSAYLKSFNALMVSEGDRRRNGIALKRAGSDPGAAQKDADNVVAMEKYKKAAKG